MKKLLSIKLLLSILSEIAGLSYCSIALYLQYVKNDFVNIVIMLFIYYLLIFSIGLFVLEYFAGKVSLIKAIRNFFISKKGLYSAFFVAFCLLIIPIGKYLLEDFVLIIALIISFSLSLICYIHLTKAAQ